MSFVRDISIGEWSGARVKYEAHIILETAVFVPEISFSKVLSALDLTGEYSTTERAVGEFQEVMRERGVCVRMSDDGDEH